MEMLAVGILSTLALVFVAWPLVTPGRHRYYLENMLGLGDQKKLNYLYSKRALVYDNIKDPVPLCNYLSGPDFSELDIGFEMRSAANWTTTERKNRRDNLALFLRNWFRNANKPDNRGKTTAEVSPRYHEKFPGSE